MTSNTHNSNTSEFDAPSMTHDDPGQLHIGGNHAMDREQRGAWSEDQLVALMDRYEAPIYNYLCSILRDRDVALDCAQDTFLRAFEALCKGRVVTSSWLYTVAHNRAVDEFRRKRRMEPDDSKLLELPSRATPIESAVDARAILDRLCPLDRDVLYLFEIAGFTTDEIGTMLGVRGSAIRQRLTRARQRFRALYSPEPSGSASAADHVDRPRKARVRAEPET